MQAAATFRLANRLYRRCFPLYRAAYWTYKRVSDRALIRHARALVHPGMTVLDIGGNIGFYAALLARWVGPTGRVHVFEPAPDHCARLARLAQRLPQVSLHSCAAAERTGTTRLWLSDDLNSDHRTYDSGDGRRCIEVPCLAIDDLLETEESIGFVKIDLQGADLHALRGLERTLARSRSVAILGEYWPDGLRLAGNDPQALLDLLEGWGFRVTLFDESFAPDRVTDHATRARRAANGHAYTNYLAIKRSEPRGS